MQSAPLSGAAASIPHVGSLATYIELRDELWHEIIDRPLNDNASPARRSLDYSVGLLELANKVVTVILAAQMPGVATSLETLRCGVCATFIDRVKAEIKAADTSVKIDLGFICESLASASSIPRSDPAAAGRNPKLQAALPTEGTIPPPVPSEIPVKSN